MATLNDKYGVSELRQGGNKSLAQGLEEYLNPEFAEPNTLRKFIGNAVSNAREMVGMDDESLARNQGLQSASQKLFDYTLGRKKGQPLSPEERADLEAKAMEYAVNLGSLSPAMGTVKAVIGPAERAKNLAKFMEGSKVTEPVYHGTNANAYSKDKFQIFNANNDRGGAYFSSSPEISGQYGEDIYKTHLSIKNPLVIDADGQWWDNIVGSSNVKSTATDKLKEEQFKRFNEENDLYKEFSDMIGDDFNPREYKQKLNSISDIPLLSNEGNEIDKISKIAKKMGYDGLIVENVKDSPVRGIHNEMNANTYVAFSPNQIKSATGNSGIYDPSDPNILHSLAPIGILGGLGSLYGTNEDDR